MITSSKKRTAILGGGISGMVLASQLADDDTVTIYDEFPRLGGNHKCRNIGPYTFDIGAFFFVSHSPLFKIFPSVWPMYLPIKQGRGRLASDGRVYKYPLFLQEHSRHQSMMATALDLMDLAASKLRYIRKADVPSYAKYYMGDRIYRRSGLKNYIERLFDLPDVEIDVTFAEKRLEEIERTSSVRNMLAKYFKKTKKPPELRVRPEAGFEQVYGQIQRELEQKGIELRLGAKYESVRKEGHRFRVVADGESREYDRVISTIPTNETAKLLGLEWKPLPTMSLVSLYFSLKGELGFPYNVLYNFSDRGRWKRVTMFSSFYGLRNDREFFTVEITVPPDEQIDISALAADFQAHMQSANIMRGDLQLEGHDITPSAYPVYRRTDRGLIESAKQRCLDTGIELAGRQGRFDYIPTSAIATRKVLKYLESGDWS